MSGSNPNNAGGGTASEDLLIEDPFARSEIFTDPRQEWKLAKSITTNADPAIEQLVRECYAKIPGIDIDLLRAAIATAARIQKSQHYSIGYSRYHKQRLAAAHRLNNQAHIFNATIFVARLNLDSHSPTKTETIIAALFQNVIAFSSDPEITKKIKDEITSRYMVLVSGREIDADLRRSRAGAAIAEAMELSIDAARMSAIPSPQRLFNMTKDELQTHFSGLLEAILHPKHTRTLPLKITEMVQRLRTINDLKDEDDKRALIIYAKWLYVPLARRLGWHEAYSEMEDTIFRLEEPNEYARIRGYVESRYGEDIYTEGSKKIKSEEDKLRALIKEHTGMDVEIKGRVKRPYSISQKIKRRKVSLGEHYGIDDVKDLIAFRIIVPDENPEQCYKVLEVLRKHSGMEENLAYFDDYISKPKENGYQSLQAVFNDKEIQIRTPRMHHEAEFGVAEHNGYKGSGNKTLDDNVLAIRARLWKRATRKEIDVPLSREFVFAFDNHGNVHKMDGGNRIIDFIARAATDGKLPNTVIIDGVWHRLTKELAMREVNNWEHIRLKHRKWRPHHPYGSVKIDASWRGIAKTEAGNELIESLLLARPNPQARSHLSGQVPQ